MLRLTRDQSVTAEALANAIEKDPTLTAKLLRMVNSPLFGLRREVTSVKEAVSYAGWRAVRVTALSVSLAGRIDAAHTDGFEYQAFWKSSLTCAIAARSLGSATRPELAEEAFVAGLLWQIGRLAAHKAVPELYRQVIERHQRKGGAMRDAERAVLGVDGAQIGRAVLEHWGMPEGIAVAVGACMGAGLTELTGQSRDIALLAHAATLISQLFCSETSPATLDQVKGIVQRCANIQGEALEGLLADLDSHIRRAADDLSLDIGDTTEYDELCASAAMELAALSVQAEAERVSSLHRAQTAESRADRLHQEHKRILEVASTDKLTQIANRVAFDKRFEEEFALASRSGQSLGLMILDIDHFKQFNDAYGHQAGDEVLRAVASTLKDTAQGVGYPARFGGEEFVVVMRCDHQSQAVALGEKIRAAIDRRRVRWEGASLQATVSVGVATMQPVEQDVSFETLLTLADRRLYEAKRGGRNRVVPAAA